MSGQRFQKQFLFVRDIPWLRMNDAKIADDMTTRNSHRSSRAKSNPPLLHKRVAGKTLILAQIFNDNALIRDGTTLEKKRLEILLRFCRIPRKSRSRLPEMPICPDDCHHGNRHIKAFG